MSGRSAPAARAEGHVVRRLAPAQWATLRQVRLAALADAPYAFGSTLARELGFDEQRWRDRIESAATLLAWQDDQPVGSATGLADDASQVHSVAGAWQLAGMWVSPQARGSGVADKLVSAVMECARAQGATAVVLWVTDVNVRARAFYQRLGFSSTGARQLIRPGEPDHWEEQLIRPLS